MRRNNIMKVIELLIQGNKVWDKDKKGYFELDQDRKRLYFTDINTKRRRTNPTIALDLALREGEIYEEVIQLARKKKETELSLEEERRLEITKKLNKEQKLFCYHFIVEDKSMKDAYKAAYP